MMGCFMFVNGKLKNLLWLKRALEYGATAPRIFQCQRHIMLPGSISAQQILLYL
jgi:hypothetical protein